MNCKDYKVSHFVQAQILRARKFGIFVFRVVDSKWGIKTAFLNPNGDMQASRTEQEWVLTCTNAFMMSKFFWFTLPDVSNTRAMSPGLVQSETQRIMTFHVVSILVSKLSEGSNSILVFV